MRPGQEPKPAPTPGAHLPTITKRELLEVSGISANTFDTIRKAARVRGPGHGGLKWEFSIEDVQSIILRAESGKWSERGLPAARAWRELLRSLGQEMAEK